MFIRLFPRFKKIGTYTLTVLKDCTILLADLDIEC